MNFNGENFQNLEITDKDFKFTGTINLKWFGYPMYFLFIITYSFLSVYLTGESYLITPLSWLLDMFVFYLWHTQAHHNIIWIPFNSNCHNWHNLHHHKYFPAKYFYGSPYAKKWIENYSNEFNLITNSLPLGELKLLDSIKNESFGIGLFIIVNFIKYFIFKLKLPIIILTIIQGLIINFIGNYLHLSFHVRNHWLNKFEFYQELKYLHWLHHKYDTKHNYGIFFFGFDKLFETYLRTYTKN